MKQGGVILTAGRNIKSQRQDWCTPEKYVKAIHKFFDGQLDLDPCSNDNSIINAKVEFVLPDKNGLVEEWKYKNIYVNPPYGRDYDSGTTIKDWFRKCNDTYQKYQSEILSLVPVATNTSHWKEYVFGCATAICFLSDTRLKFRINGSEENKGSPVANAIIYWGNNQQKFKDVFSNYGAIVYL